MPIGAELVPCALPRWRLQTQGVLVDEHDGIVMLKISGGKIFDPANGIDGKIGDIWIDEGRIQRVQFAEGNGRQQEPRETLVAARVIDARGLVVMPGGIDMHCHIAGPKVNAARMMRPEDRQSDPFEFADPVRRGGKMGSVPSTFTTGYRYAAMGYTTAFDAAISPAGARSAHAQFQDTPCVDNGFFALVGNNHFILDCVRRGDNTRLQNFLGWLLGTVRAYAPKLVNPGGVEQGKRRIGGNELDLDIPIDGFDVSPRQVIAEIVEAANELGLPHPAHIHCNNLGIPGNWRTTLETMKSIGGQRAHLAHIQFHSYGGGDEVEDSLCSKVQPLAEYVNQHSELTVDVGQVVFGNSTSLTGDGPLGNYLRKLHGGKWYSDDLECESGCGISPIRYRNRNLVSGLQWAIGLEWYLSVNNPWQIALSSDHPNGGSFVAYPHIISLLMDAAKRREFLDRAPPELANASPLRSMDREYSLNEIAIITRAGPAKMLGLSQKGHLGEGADADITVYVPDADVEQMFQMPKFVCHGGEFVIDNYELCRSTRGRGLVVQPEMDAGRMPEITQWFERNYSIDLESYRVPDPQPS